MRHGIAADGARIGAAIGLLALAVGFPAGGWWLPAAIPAGAVAGAWAGSRIDAGGPVRARLVATVAMIATVVGAAVISAGLALGSASARDAGAAAMLGTWVGLTVLALLSLGWLALVVLLPVSAAAIAIVRSRAARLELAPGPARRPVWLGGLVVGIASGVLALTLPVVGYEIALLFAAGGFLGRRSMAAIGGLLFGAGVGWVTLIGNGALSCRPADCVPPDLAPWLAVGLAMVTTGSVLSVVAAARG